MVGPPALVQISRSDQLAVNPGGFVPAITTDRTGYWVYYTSCDSSGATSGTGDAYVECNVRQNYGGYIYGKRYYVDHSDGSIHFGYCYMAWVGAGTVFDVNCGTYYVSQGTWTVAQYLWFIPTA